MSFQRIGLVGYNVSFRRIGLVGYNVFTGLGELNRQIDEYVDIYRWLIKPHSVLRVNELSENTDCIVCPTGEKVDEFLKQVDTVLFCETPYYPNLVHKAKAQGKRVVCVPMIEWATGGWMDLVDLFICPTKYCYDELNDRYPCTYFPWPIDVTRYDYKPRTNCNSFVYIEGFGGTGGRKGLDIITNLLRHDQWPQIPIIIYSQRGQSHLPTGPLVDIRKPPKDNRDLYYSGDVLLHPHKCDGLGLQLMEASACGMPVITTQGDPWDEMYAMTRIASSKSAKQIRRRVNWYQPDCNHLLEQCVKYFGTDISLESRRARDWAESRDWHKQADTFMGLVLGADNVKLATV